MLVGVAQVNDSDDVLLINDLGIIIRFRAGEIPILGRNTSGVTLMRSREGLVVDMSIVSGDDDDEHEAVNGEVLPEDESDTPFVCEADEDDEVDLEIVDTDRELDD
jgi:DNA gyrase subunit A